MKKLLLSIFTFITVISFAQESPTAPPDSIGFTELTTTDFMQVRGTATMNWSSTYAARWCLFKCGGPTIADNRDCCSLWEWLGQAWVSIFGEGGGGGGNPTLLNNNTESSGGGGSGYIFIPYGSPSNPPVHTPSGGGGGAPPSGPFVTIVTPPPTNPVFATGGSGSPPSPRTDTTKPQAKYNCDSIDLKRGDSLTAILDSLENSPQLKQIRDSLPITKKESGFSINFTNGKYIPVNYQRGDTANVQVATDIAGMHLVGGLHDHPIGVAGYAPGPSPVDIYHLIEGFLGNQKYRYDYAVGASGDDWALSVTDSATVSLFKNKFPKHKYVDTIKNQWNNDTILPLVNYKTYDFWFELTAALNKAPFNYPLERAQTYANLFIMTQIMKPGVDLYVKDQGKMRKLDMKLEFVGGALSKIIVTICK